MAQARYPYQATGFVTGKTGKKNVLHLLQTGPALPAWFLGPDPVTAMTGYVYSPMGFGSLKRWNGSHWVQAYNVRVKSF